MVKRDELIAFIFNYLGKDLLYRASQRDDLANGIQILGNPEVGTLALGVSCDEEFLTLAAKAGANFCLTHHGLDTRTHKSRFPLYFQKRLKLIFRQEMTVAGFHYTLDAHPEIGNNAVIIKKLGAKIQDTLFQEFGFTARFDQPQGVRELARQCQTIMGHEVLAVYSGPEKVTTIGVVSGAGKPYAPEIAEMEAKGVELFLSGETTESLPARMKETGINYFACGHYATEVFGVKELGRVIGEHFRDKLAIEFISQNNPI